MKILNQPIRITELKQIATGRFGNLIKAVVDIDRELIAIDAELHADLESLLLENGSLQENLWGINFYPDLQGDDFIEFDSMINMRPSRGNMTRGVENESIRKKIIAVSNTWINP